MDIYAYEYEGNLYVNLTNRCTNDCEFCIRRNGDGIGSSGSLWLKREPTAFDVISAIKMFDVNAYADVVFCGYGEPTYALDVLLEVAEFAHSINKRTRLNTNGHADVINARSVAPMLVGKIDVVSISLNQSSSAKYDALCSPIIANAFDTMLNFARACVECGLQTILSVVAVDGVDVDECQRVADSVGAKLRVRSYIE